MNQKRYIYTFKDLLAIADELGYPGERQGSAATLDSNIDKWVYTEQQVPVEVSPLLEQWISDHHYDEDSEPSPDTPDTSDFPSEEPVTEGEGPVAQAEEPSPAPEVQPEIVSSPQSPTTPVTMAPNASEPVPPSAKSASSSALPRVESAPSPPAKAPKPTRVKPPKYAKKAKVAVAKAPRAMSKSETKKESKTKAGISMPKSLGKTKVQPSASVTKRRSKGKSLQQAKKPPLKSLSVLSAYQTTCSSADIERINQLLLEAHSVKLTPAVGGLRIKDCGRIKALGRPEGRVPTRWTPEELEVVTPLKAALKLKSLPDLLRMLKKEPIPAAQAQNLPESARLIDLLRETKLDPATGEQVRCAPSILRMRATVLLLRYEASKVSGRRVYY